MFPTLLKRINRHSIQMTADEAFNIAWYYRRNCKNYTEYARYMAVYNLCKFRTASAPSDRLIHWAWTRRYMALITHDNAWKLGD